MPDILITGGTRGLGLAIAEKFAKQGHRLFLTYRSDKENASNTREKFRKAGVECFVIEVDLSENGASEKLFEQVKAVTSRLSVYVHNAAATAFKPLMDIKPHHIAKTFNITVTSFISNVQLVVPMMPEGGAIVSVSGLDTRQAVPFHGLLGAAKSALETLTAYWAHELATKNIRVNGVNPGYLETDSIRKYFGPLFEKASARFSKMTPGRKTARLEDVASVVEFLASENSRWILGQTIVVDGGQTFVSPALDLEAK